MHFFCFLLCMVFISVTVNAKTITIYCQNDYKGQINTPDGQWKEDKIETGKGEIFHIDTKLLPNATLSWQQKDNMGSQTLTSFLLDNSVVFFETMLDGINVYQYYFSYNKMFRTKINSILGAAPYAGVWYTSCTYTIQ